MAHPSGRSIPQAAVTLASSRPDGRLSRGPHHGGLWAGPWLFARLTCRSGLLPTSNVWSQDGECVGLSDGPYAFGLSAFDPVFQTIARQNKQAGQNPCATGAPPVTVGVLVTSTSLAAGGRANHELEGFAAGQANANKAGCVRPVQLRIAQIGRTEQAAGEVARLIADSPNVVAVVGMGPSDPHVVGASNGHGNHTPWPASPSVRGALTGSKKYARPPTWWRFVSI